jgi:integrase
MSVFKLKDAKARSLPWRAVISRHGSGRLTKQFPTRQEAEMWEEEQKKRERLKDVPEYQRMVELKELAQHTVRDLVEYYIANNQHLGRNNLITLNAFLREDICNKNLLQLSKQDMNRFIEKKKHETWKPPGSNAEERQLSPRTIRRLLNIVQRVFSWSIEFRAGFEALPNHFQGIRVQGSTGGKRRRSLDDGELDRIITACKKCHDPNNYYLPLAIYLGIDTGMRRQEIFNLIWKDIDPVNRRITVRKSKTDKATGNLKGVNIVLPALALHLLTTLAMIRHKQYGLPTEKFENREGEYWAFPKDNEQIFPMTERAFSQAWGDVLKRAGIEGLHFHDLRREANHRFIRAGLSDPERNLMLRHADKSMNAVYQGDNMLHDIRDKLDRYVLNGMTLKEAYEKGVVDFDVGKNLHLPIGDKQKNKTNNFIWQQAK